MPIEGNIVLISIDEFIDNYCMIFNEKAYLEMLEYKANDSEFLNNIEEITASAKLKYLEEISRVYNLNVDKGVEYLNDFISKQGDIEKITNFFDEINRLNKRLASDKSGNDLNSIKRDLEVLRNDISNTFSNKEYSEEVTEKIEELNTRLKNFEILFNKTLESFIFDKDYEEKVTMRFNTNRIWPTRFGIHTNNLFVNTDTRRYDEHAIPQEICECKQLPATLKTLMNNRIFTPLVLDHLVYLSEDGRSLSCYDTIRKTLERVIDLDDQIISSGALMYLVSSSYIILGCKKGIKIFSIKDKKLLDFKADYVFNYDENIDIKSMNVFNNRCYINIADYSKGISYLYSIKYDFMRKAFVPKCSVLSSTLVGNVILAYDKRIQQVRVSYMTSNKKLYEINPDTLDPINEYNIDYVPLDGCYNVGREVYYTSPVLFYKGNVFYTAYTDRRDLYLCKLSLLELLNDAEANKNISEYLMTSEIAGFIATKQNQLIPTLSNICVDDNYAYIINSNPVIKQIRSIPHNNEGRGYQVRQHTELIKANFRNQTAIKYNKDLINLDTAELKEIRVLSLCQKYVVACQDLPMEGKYKLFIIDCLKENM